MMARHRLYDREVEVAAGKFRDGLPAVVLTMDGLTVRLTLTDAETLAEAMIRTVRAAEETNTPRG